MSNFLSQEYRPSICTRAWTTVLPSLVASVAIFAWSSTATAADRKHPPQRHAPPAHAVAHPHAAPVAQHRPQAQHRAPIAHRPPAAHSAPIAHRTPGGAHRAPIAHQPPAAPRNPIAARTPGRNQAPNRGRAGFHQNPPAIAARDWQGRSGDRTVNQTFNQSTRVSRNSTYVYAPQVVARDWDRGHDHSWNNHRYHWRDGLWISIDPGYDYSAPGYDGYTTYSAAPAGVSPGLVRNVQSALNSQGYDAGTPDGVMGPQTRDAIRAYQNDHGLAVTGWIDRPVMNSLGV